VVLTLLRCALGVALLSDISFRPIYPKVGDIPVQQAGLSRMDPGLLKSVSFTNTITETFWWYFPAILADGKVSQSVDPITCSGDLCDSYFFPGPLSIVQFNPNTSAIQNSDYPLATAFIQEDAPGYQIDFSPIESSDPSMTLDDCQVYGLSVLAFQLCLKSSRDSILAGNTSEKSVNVSVELLPNLRSEKFELYVIHGLANCGAI